MLLAGAVTLIAAIVVLRGGDPAQQTKQFTLPAGARPTAIATGAAPSVAATPRGARGLPPGLDDRGWVAEIDVQRWAAGSLSGHVIKLPNDEIALTATATSVVSVRYGNGGATSTVRVRDLSGSGRLRVSVDRPGTVSSAVISGDTVYVAGDAAAGGGSDAGVQAISITDGAVRDVIPGGPAPADATGPVTRAQLRLDPTGHVLGSALCSGEDCSVEIVDLVSGTRTRPVDDAHGFLIGLTNRVLYLVDGTSTSLDALDAVTGELRWHLDDIQIGGLVPTSDGSRVVLSYLPGARAAAPTFTLAAADAATGARQILLERAADTDAPTFYPNLSGDRFAVIGGGATLGELLGGAHRRASLTLVDTRSGATQPDAVVIAAP